jgi:two-component system response regulator
MMRSNERCILLAEDNPDDGLLTLTAVHYNKIMIKGVVARDGDEALDYLSGTGNSSDADFLPQIILPDLNLPDVNVQKIQSAAETMFFPVEVPPTAVSDSLLNSINSHMQLCNQDFIGLS